MFQILVYHLDAAAAGGANVDATAALDAEFSQRNNHYIFSEQYRLLAWHAGGVSLTDARFNIPSVNTIARDHCWPLDRSATPGSYRRIRDLRERPAPLPVNEEIAIELSNNLACGTEAEASAIFIAPPKWNRNADLSQDDYVPKVPGNGRIERLVIRATASPTRVAHQWSGLVPITFAENIRGGWYSVFSIWVFSANARYFRVAFPRMPLYMGRRLRPGSVVSHAIGDIEEPIGSNFFGRWGSFHSFEPFQIEEFADGAGADNNIEIRIDCAYLGGHEPPGYAPTGAELQFSP